MATTALSIENQWDFSGLAFLMKDLVISGSLFIGGNGMSSTELGFLDGVVAGTAAVSKALVLSAGGAIGTITSLTATTFAGTPNFSGATTFGSTVGVTGAITPTGGVAAAGGFTVTPRNCHTGGNPASVSTDFSDYTVVATETIRAEIFVPANMSSTGVAPLNGSAVAGNVQCWLIDSTGASVAATASTAQSGPDTYQRIAWVSGPIALKGPATYWIAMQGNTGGGTSKINTHTIGNFGADKQTATTFGALTVATAPTTFTTALGPVASLY